jgi:hypothetical protein
VYLVCEKIYVNSSQGGRAVGGIELASGPKSRRPPASGASVPHLRRAILGLDFVVAPDATNG